MTNDCRIANEADVEWERYLAQKKIESPFFSTMPFTAFRSRLSTAVVNSFMLRMMRGFQENWPTMENDELIGIVRILSTPKLKKSQPLWVYKCDWQFSWREIQRAVNYADDEDNDEWERNLAWEQKRRKSDWASCERSNSRRMYLYGEDCNHWFHEAELVEMFLSLRDNTKVGHMDTIRGSRDKEYRSTAKNGCNYPLPQCC
jgi:hypothetical protein